MFEFCRCFRSNPQVTDNGSQASRQRRAARNSIRKEADLLDMNKNGMNEEEWIDDAEDPNDPVRVSH